jgi:hypothetical protein
MTYDPLLAKREAIRVRLNAGLTVMFKRAEYNPAGNYSGRPLWHRLERIEVLEKFDSGAVKLEKWVAVCGYEHKVEPWLYGQPDVRHDVKTKKIRCSKCDKKAV